jgi:hypothetical protein
MTGASGANLTWATDGGGNIGASGATRPNHIWAKGNIEAVGYIKATSYLTSSSFISTTGYLNAVTYFRCGNTGRTLQLRSPNVGGFGLGANSSAIYGEGTVDTLQIAGSRADGAGNISLTFDADVRLVAPATINAEHIVADIGWLSSTDVRTSIGRIRGSGSFEADGEVRVGGDVGGLAGCTTLTNGTGTAGSNAPSMINLPGSSDGTQDGWLKLYVGTTAVWVPYWNN